jgi:hypothetical protein
LVCRGIPPNLHLLADPHLLVLLVSRIAQDFGSATAARVQVRNRGEAVALKELAELEW